MESTTAKYIESLELSVKDHGLRLNEIRVIIECFNDKNCKIESLIKGLEVARVGVSWDKAPTIAASSQ